MTAAWISSPAHRRWLAQEADRLLDFAEGARLPGGFGWLDEHGTVVVDRSEQLWITTRMTYAFSLAALWGRPGAAPLAAHGITSLLGPMHDDEHGGWFSVGTSDAIRDDAKKCYEVAFVVLAASAARTAGISGADTVLAEALDTLDRFFWVPDDGLARDLWNRDFTVCSPYRGANANMHLTEAYLAAADALDDQSLARRALSIAERLIDTRARAHDWRLPEHYDADWNPVLDHHRSEPRHPYQPFGVTPGHLLEWSRLLICLRTSLSEPPAWLTDASQELFARGSGDGWREPGGGFAYTVDFTGADVVPDRLHWVAAEAIAAAATLEQAAGPERRGEYELWYRRSWDWTEQHLIDREHGSWHHELDDALRVSTTTWPGKPDAYHALQATLTGRLPLVSSFARGIADGQLST